MRQDLIIIDGNNLAHKAINTKKEFFISMITKTIRKFRPTHLVICFDEVGDNFRKKLYPEYKANRTNSTNVGLHNYITDIRNILVNNEIAVVSSTEGDDIICTMGELFDGYSFVISEDRDLLQIVNDKRYVYSPSKRTLYTIDKVQKLYGGLLPEKIKYIKCLAGDTSDNIKGVHGIGIKTAIKLLTKYNNLDDIYLNINNLCDILSNKAINSLIDQKDLAYLSLELTTLRCDIIQEYDFNKAIVDKYSIYNKLANCYNEIKVL